MRSLTVVIVDEGERGRCARDIAARWSRQGLLRESLWLTTAEAAVPDSGPPRVTATLLSRSAEESGRDLFTQIAVRNLKLVRVVLLQQLPWAGQGEGTVLETGRKVAELIRGRLPRDTSNEDESGTRLVRVNLLVPESGVGQLSPDLLVPGWEINALASPEDRPDLGHASLFVRADVNFDAHAVAAVACAGGLWPGIRDGAFDDVEVDSTSGASDLLVFRPSARVLLGDSLPRRLADHAMTLAQDPNGRGAAQYLTWAAVAESPEHRVTTAMEELATRGDWARDLLREMPEVPRSEMSIGGAVADLARFQVRLAAAAGRVIVNSATRWVENRVTDMTAGSEGQYVARVVPRTPDEVENLAQRRLDEQTESLHSGLLRREADKSQPPLPSTWVELRQLCFGLVDGSPLPDGFTLPERAGVRELLPPGAVVPPPADHFLSEDGTVVRPVDIDAAALLRARIAPDAEVTDQPTDVASATPEITGQAPEPTETDRLDEWVDRRESALLWRLAHTVWRRRQLASEVEEASYAGATDAGAPGVDAVRRSRQRLLMCWALVAVLVAGSAAWAGIKYWLLDSLTTSELWKGSAIVIGASLVLALGGGWQYYRALSKFERQVEQRIAERRHAAERYVIARREQRRLHLLYRGVQDWAEVIGWVVHKPWVVQAEAASSLDIDATELPAAVALGVPATMGDDLSDDLVYDAVGVLCTRGWLRSLFDELVTTDIASRKRAHSERGHLPADLDTGLTGQGPRAQLRTALSSLSARAELAETARVLVEQHVAEGTLKLPEREVNRLGAYSSPEPISDEQFFRGALGPATPFVDELWTPNGMQGHCHLVAHSIAWLPSSRSEDGTTIEVRPAASGASLRVDLSRSCATTDLAVFASQVPAQRNVHTVIEPEGEWV